MRFAIFPFHLSKVLRLPRKSEARSYEVLHFSRKIIFPKLKIWCSKMQPGPPNISDEHVSLQILFKCPTPAIVFGNDKTLTFCSLLTRCKILCACHAKRHLNVQKCSAFLIFLHFWLWHVLYTTMAYTFSISQLLKVLRSWGVLHILTSKCASHHNGVHFFSTSQVPKVLRTCQCFALLTLKCASRHYGVQFFTSHLASWLHTCRFSEPTFRPSWPTNHCKKHSVLRLSYLFAHLHLLSSDSFFSLIFFLLLFSSLTLPISAFHLSILSEVWLLNFLRLFNILISHDLWYYHYIAPIIEYPSIYICHYSYIYIYI